MLTLIKKDISSLFTVIKARPKRGKTDTKPGQLKDPPSNLFSINLLENPPCLILLQFPLYVSVEQIVKHICVCMNVRVEEVLFMQQMQHRFIFHHFRPLQPISRAGE